MSQRETYKGAEVSGDDGTAIQVEELVRYANNQWTGHFRLTREYELPDGRRVVFNRRIRVKASEQIGRRPARVG